MGKGAAACAPAQSAPHPGLWLSACRGVHRTGVRKASDSEAEHLLLWQSLQHLLRKHSLHFRKELFAEDQLFNTEYLRYVRTAVSIPDIGYYYLQNSQSVSHSRVTTADILSLRRRVMLLYRDIYTELGIYPETRAAILRSPFGENEFTLPPLDTPQTHCCKL